jgi:hypothetical protein
MTQRLIDEVIFPYILQNRDILIIGGLVFIKELFEYWIGKTDKVEAGSTLELVIFTINKIKEKIKNAFKK